jgi:hypothetical protein
MDYLQNNQNYLKKSNKKELNISQYSNISPIKKPENQNNFNSPKHYQQIYKNKAQLIINPDIKYSQNPNPNQNQVKKIK